MTNYLNVNNDSHDMYVMVISLSRWSHGLQPTVPAVLLTTIDFYDCVLLFSAAEGNKQQNE